LLPAATILPGTFITISESILTSSGKTGPPVAVLTGKETDADLETLGKDVFSYFGLGCRNVSKVYLPANADPTRLLQCWPAFQEVMIHHKYHNNYDYQKSILLVNRVPHFDAGFVLLQEMKNWYRQYLLCITSFMKTKERWH
jgi:hypothetical protein